MRKIRIVAIISAHNEGDVIYHVIGDLVQQGIEVYLIDHCSTDDTVEQAFKWLGKGLLRVERFPEEAGYADRNKEQYVWTDILQRKQELAASLGADWYIHHDADEFREGPFPGVSLRASIVCAHLSGFNAIDFALLNFRPTDNRFQRGDDVRKYLGYFEWGEQYNSLQIKAWRNTGRPIDLVTHGGHSVLFTGRRIFPLKFILRHYPIRSQQHGEQKVLKQRKGRFAEEERAKQWHLQYDEVEQGHHFLCNPDRLRKYRPLEVSLWVVMFRIRNFFKLLWGWLRETMATAKA
jgi:glycosyltransferase involved in cell wall biosynthesis